MTNADAREGLRRALLDRGHDLATASKAIGRNHAYLQQFIKTGKPRYLHEQDRERLASLYKIDVSALKPQPKESPAAGRAATRTTPRPGDPIEDDREAMIVDFWRKISKDDQEIVLGMLDGLLLRRGKPTIAA